MTEERTEYSIIPFETVLSMGEVFAKSGYFSDAQEQAQAVVKMLAGQEMGVGPFASMSGIHIIKGKPEVGAHLLAAVLKRSGKYDYRVKQPIQPDSVTLEFFERAIGSDAEWRPVGTSTFTAEDAKRAGTGNMQKFPRNMLFARALSNGVKWYCPDVSLSPLYTTGEIDPVGNAEYTDDDVIEGVVVEQPEPKPLSNGRPWAPNVLKANLLKKAEHYRNKDEGTTEPPEDGVRGYCASLLNQRCGNDDRRHIFLKYIYGDESIKARDRADVIALTEWAEGQHKNKTIKWEIVHDEANRLVNSIVDEQPDDEPNDVG